MNDREINLVDLTVEILLDWRRILIWMLVGGVLFGALSYVRSYRTGQVDLSTKAEFEQELLTEKQLNNVNLALEYETYAAERQAYIDNSILMQVDAQNMPQAKLTFLVAGADKTQTAEIVKIYEDLVLGGLLEWLQNEFEEEYTTANYSEVITFNRSSGDLEQGSNSFSLSVVHVTEEKCRELADGIERYMAEQESTLQEQLGQHTIKTVNRSFAHVVNAALLAEQRSCRSEVTSLRNSAAQLKDAFSEAEEEYYNTLIREAQAAGEEETPLQTAAGEESGRQTAAVRARTAAAEGRVSEAGQDAEAGNATGEMAQENSNEDIASAASVSPTYVLLGMVLFAFGYVFLIFLKYILNNRIRVSDDVKALYGVSQLALIPAERDKKRWFGFVDKWLMAVRNRNKRVFDREEAIGLAAVAVKLAAKKEEVDTVYCIGCDIKAKTEAVAERIKAALGEENISLQVLSNVLYNQETMEQLQKAKAVVLIEKAGETLYGEIARELELLQRQEIAVLGAVIVE